MPCSLFSVGDYVEWELTDGYRIVAKIESINNGYGKVRISLLSDKTEWTALESRLFKMTQNQAMLALLET